MINWNEGLDGIDMEDPHGVWQKLEAGEFRPAEGQERIRVTADGNAYFNAMGFKPEGTWVIPYPTKGRPPWFHRVMARILLGWKWEDA